MAPSENFVKYRSKQCCAVAAVVVAVAIVAHAPVANYAMQSLDHYSIEVSANLDLRPNHD